MSAFIRWRPSISRTRRRIDGWPAARTGPIPLGTPRSGGCASSAVGTTRCPGPAGNPAGRRSDGPPLSSPTPLRQVPDRPPPDRTVNRPSRAMSCRVCLATTQLARDRLQAGLEPAVRVQLVLQLADALLELADLHPEAVGLGDLRLVAQDHPVGGPERRPRAVRPPRLERAPAALAEDAVQ